MEPSPRESAPSGRERVIEELVRGQDYAKKLKDIFATRGNNPDSEGELTRDLVKKVLSSFDNSLSVLSHDQFEVLSSFDNSLSVLSHDQFEEVSQVVVVAHPMKRGKPSASKEDSEGSVRSSLPTPRNRRGCYKRRSNGETWTKLTPSMSADDYQWRKYGQKPILDAAHPRNYFRCTHKSDQGCLATKQVQKISDDPIKFSTIYQGRHTCTDNRRRKLTEIVSDNYGSNNPGISGSPVLISFERNNTISTPLKNEETSDGFLGNKGVVVPSASSDNDYFNIFGPRGDISIISSDPGDVMSSGHQGSYLAMAMGWDDTADFALEYGSAGDV